MIFRKRKTMAPDDYPTVEQLERELDRQRYKRSFLFAFRGTVNTLITVAAVAVLVAVLLLPVLEIYGESMSPTLTSKEFVVCVKGGEFQTGDICAFYYNNKILVKRVIARSGDWVNIEEDGTVFVNGQKLDEPYVTELAFGDCDIDLPYQVPDSKYFVIGDHRDVSIDSRNTVIGCVAEEQIVGKIVFRVWPLNKFGSIG